MPLSHLLIALGVVAIWGTNFTVVKLGLATWPPMMFVALRFLLSALPVLVVPRPKAPWVLIAAYGLFIGAGQFGLMFYAIQNDITPGLASLIIQVQAFFTIGLSAWLFGEPVKREHIAGLLLAGAGIGLIAWKSGALTGAVTGGAGTPQTVTTLGIAMILGAAACWSTGNIVVKRIGRIEMLPFMAWSSLFPGLALLVLSLLFEGPGRIGTALSTAGVGAWSAAIWQAVANTLIGYGAWSWLLARHPAVQVAPMALLVPVFGMGASAIVLGEPLPWWKIAAALMVMGGLALTVFAGRLRRSS